MQKGLTVKVERINEVTRMSVDTWTSTPTFCPNCGVLCYGHRNNEKKVRYECGRCKVVFIRIRKGRRHDTIELFTAMDRGN